MSAVGEKKFDAVIAGGGIVGTACALAFARKGLRTALVERDQIGGGASAAGMGHIVVLDGSDAQFALSRRSQILWRELQKSLPAEAEYREIGTLWVAADEEEMADAERKHGFYSARDLSAHLLTKRDLETEEPNLRHGLAGGVLIPRDGAVFPPAVAQFLLRQAQDLGTQVFLGSAVKHFGQGEAELEDGTRLVAPRLVNAAGADAPFCMPGLPLQKRKGHLAITDRYPDFVHHQIVELGYVKKAGAQAADSVSFNVQPRMTGQVLIGSSRQYGSEAPEVEQAILGAMLRQAMQYLPALGRLNILRTWTGFRAATPDKLPLIGPVPADSSLWLATGHEGLGITTALATAELLAAAFCGEKPSIDPNPFLPARFLATHINPASALTTGPALQEML
jgi:glycine/D-amino acid oxidase-like deaminating enzyme